MVSNEYEQLSSEALEAARICANKYDFLDLLRSFYTRLTTYVTGTLSKSPARRVSISVSALILTMLSASTRCCPVPVPIDCRLECVVPGASPMDLLPV